MHTSYLYMAVGSCIILQHVAIDHKAIAYTETQEKPVVPPLERLCFGAEKVD